MDYPTTVKGYELTNPDKVRRAIEGTPTRDGSLAGGILQPDGTYDDDMLLAAYDKMGGGIRKNGDVVKNGSFYDYKRKAKRETPEVVYTFRINGSVVEVKDEEEEPLLVKAAKAVKELEKGVTTKKTKKSE